MSIAPILRPRILVMFALALILAVSAYGFAAANTIDTTNAGDGAGAISGYTVADTDVVYVLEAADPTKIDTITFTLTPDSTGATPSVVKVQLAAGGAWYDADNGGSGNDWVVDPAAGALSAASVTTLHIVAHD
jgi:hypothetical protein